MAAGRAWRCRFSSLALRPALSDGLPLHYSRVPDPGQAEKRVHAFLIYIHNSLTKLFYQMLVTKPDTFLKISFKLGKNNRRK